MKRPPQQELMQRFDVGAIEQPAMQEPPNLVQLMQAGAPQASGFDTPWRRALFAAGASMLDSPGRSVSSALGRAAGVGLDTYDTTRQLQAQNAMSQREARTKEILSNAQVSKLQADETRKATIDANRAGLIEEFRLAETMSPEQKQIALANLAMKAASIGDTEIVGAISQMMQTMNSGSKATPLREVNVGNEKLMVDATGNVVQRFPVKLGPQAPQREPRDPVAGRPTEGNQRAAGILPRMESVNAGLEGLDAQITSRLAGGNLAGNFFATPEGRQMKVLGEAFLMGILRIESGAAISSEEMQRATATYLPQPSDDARTLQFKSQLRKEALNQVRIMSGPMKPQAAVSSFGGAGPKTAAAAERYK